ncbi:hypothetical protein [Halostella sp. PRR32]|uniref:hypothetical protein n=1 Tax=Halostella sp. PRR32 TaxID=3098147 RepID=UPI00110DA280|nr:hypothetical protein [Halostella sp. PRR32]
MNPEQIPFVRFAARFGVEDRVLAAFMLAGPLVVSSLALLGRSAVTSVLAGAYVGLFVLYVAYRGVATDGE